MVIPWDISAGGYLALGLSGMAGLAAGAYCVRAADAYAGLLARGRAPNAATMRAALSLAAPPACVAQRSTARVAARSPDPGRRPRRDGCAVAAGRLAARPAWWRSPAGAVLAAGTMALHFVHGYGFYTGLAALAGVLLLLLALIDLRTGLLPDALTLPVLGLGLAAAVLAGGEAGRLASASNALGGAAMGLAFPWLLNQIFKRLRGQEGMGGGDLKLLAGLGAWLGWQGLPSALLLACCAGLLWAMWRQKTLLPAGSYPFGPFLSAGGAYVFLAGSGLHWHFW